MDHNKLQGQLGDIYSSGEQETSVVGCVDHHDEENTVPKDTGDEPRVVQPCGSCMSLVVQWCRETRAWDGGIDRQTNTADWEREVALLAIAPILIDTTNLTSKSKVKNEDIEAIQFLEAKLLGMQDKNTFDRTTFFRELDDTKSDIGDLTLTEILRKDYKQWTENGLNLGVSSVVKDMSFLISKGNEDGPGFGQMIKQFAKEHELSLCAIMTTSTQDGNFVRELLIWGLEERGVAAAKRFEEDAKAELQLQGWQEGSLDRTTTVAEWRRCWWQRDVGKSRKQVGPLLRAAMK